jgi:hypothetical protein
MPVNAAPMTTPTAKSTTFPRMMKALNSLIQAGVFTVVGTCDMRKLLDYDSIGDRRCTLKRFAGNWQYEPTVENM